jgi:hypothetical protein
MPAAGARRAAAAGVLGALCGALLLAVGGLRAAQERRSALLGGLLPLRRAWADQMDKAVYARVAAPHRQGHRIFAPLDEPVRRSISRDIPNMVDTALEPSNNYEDKLNRKLLRLQREKEALETRKSDIIHGLISDRDWQERRVASQAVDAHHQRLRSALERARREQWSQYEKAAKRYASAKTHSTMQAGEYLKRRGRVMARIKELDTLLTEGDGQLTTAPENAPPASSGSGVPADVDLDGLLTSIEGQAAALGDDTEKQALLANVKKLHSIIAHGGSEHAKVLAVPDKRRCER